MNLFLTSMTKGSIQKGNEPVKSSEKRLQHALDPGSNGPFPDELDKSASGKVGKTEKGLKIPVWALTAS